MDKVDGERQGGREAEARELLECMEFLVRMWGRRKKGRITAKDATTARKIKERVSSRKGLHGFLIDE